MQDEVALVGCEVVSRDEDEADNEAVVEEVVDDSSDE